MFNAVSKLRRHLSGQGQEEQPTIMATSQSPSYVQQPSYPYYQPQQGEKLPGWLDFVPFNPKLGFHPPQH